MYAMRPITREEVTDAVINRLRAGVDRSGGIHGCWHWRGSVSTPGYGRITSQGRTYQTHRLAFFVATGLNPPQVGHRCERPGYQHRTCCNPAHLYATTADINMADARRAGKIRSGMTSPSRRITDVVALQVAELGAQGLGPAAISRRLPVSRPNAHKILNGLAWSAVTGIQPK